MSRVYAVPGQHDLPHHRYQDIQRSAYWTLVEAGRVVDLPPGEEVMAGPDLSCGLILHGFPWGAKLQPCDPVKRKPLEVGRVLHLAVVHAYVWRDGHCHPGVTAETHYLTRLKELQGFHAVLFGDNHRPFLFNTRLDDVFGIPTLYNHGTFIRRRSDEQHLQPQVGILMSDGTVEVHRLDGSRDRFADREVPAELAAVGVDTEELVEMMRELGDRVATFQETLRHYLDRFSVDRATEAVILSWLEKVRGLQK